MPELVGRIDRWSDVQAETRRILEYIRKCGCKPISQPVVRAAKKEVSVTISYECANKGKALLAKLAFISKPAPVQE
jgi:hypothetical protein